MSDLREYTRLCSMAIHDRIIPTGTMPSCQCIMRVPGGWIYEFVVDSLMEEYNNQHGTYRSIPVKHINHVFVPFFKEGDYGKASDK